ncbi:hypothetical protein HORIV_14610 [Vreelandella olivaria]|uniref:Uncharacterized protein n=1 Tax=Vreelandella olivaria TaxID=390919 RepID=A0ABN5WVM8_9GAMM|nr:hypothetical protein HORIV_14610 [Halomonas olivaria]
MQKLRVSNSQTLAILKQSETNASILYPYCEDGVSSAIIYSIDTSLIKELLDENRRLKNIYAKKKL